MQTFIRELTLGCASPSWRPAVVFCRTALLHRQGRAAVTPCGVPLVWPSALCEEYVIYIAEEYSDPALKLGLPIKKCFSFLLDWGYGQEG